MQRREPPAIDGVDVGVVLDEQVRDVDVAVRRRVVQRNQSALVLRVDVSTVLEQVLAHLHVVVARCKRNEILQNN